MSHRFSSSVRVAAAVAGVAGLAAFAAPASTAWTPPAVAVERPVLTPAPKDAPRPAPTEAQLVERDLRLRRDLGLAADRDLVVALRRDPAIRASENEFGAALTPAEQAEVRLRQRVGDADVPVVERYAAGRPDEFAGVWLDHAAGGVVTAAFTADPGAHARRLRELVGHPDRLRVVPARFSYADLTALTARVSSDIPALAAAGVTVASVNLDVVRNRVEVIVTEAEDVAAVADRYGPAATVLVGPRPTGASRQNSYPPMKAGLEIYSDTHACTSAFAAYRTSWFSLTAKEYFQLTAGHCGPRGTVWNHFIYVIGSGTDNRFFHNSNADAQLVTLRATDVSNKVFITDSNLRSITSRETSDYVGKNVCQSGITSGYVCGTIHSTNYTANYAEATLVNQRLATYDSIPGDSGGPNFYGNTAMGITSGRTGGSPSRMIYSWIDNALNGLGAYLVTTANG